MSFPMVALAEVLTERKEVPSDDDLASRKIRIVSKVGFNDGKIQLRYDYETRTGMILIRPGDIVVSGINAAKGAIALYDSKNAEPIAATIHYSSYIPKLDKVDTKFLWWLLRSNTFREILYEYLREGIKSELKAKRLLPIPVPLPTPAEQRRIVARIEELAAKIEEARGLRKMAEEEVDLLPKNARQVIFKNLKEKLAPVRLDSVADSRLGKMLSGDAKTGIGSTPYLRNANIQWDRLDLSSIYEMDFNEDEKENLALQKGDILVCEGGDIGKAAIWNDEIPGCSFQKALHRVRVDPSKIIPRFMLHHIFWAAEQGHFADIKTQTTIAHLTGIKLKAYGVIVPPLPDQRRIVAYLDSLQVQVDALRRIQAETSAELDALMPAVLDRAFKGEL